MNRLCRRCLRRRKPADLERIRYRTDGKRQCRDRVDCDAAIAAFAEKAPAIVWPGFKR